MRKGVSHHGVEGFPALGLRGACPRSARSRQVHWVVGGARLASRLLRAVWIVGSQFDLLGRGWRGHPGVPTWAKSFDGVLGAVRAIAAKHVVFGAIPITAPAVALRVGRVEGEGLGHGEQSGADTRSPGSFAPSLLGGFDLAQGRAVQIDFCTNQPLNRYGRRGP